MLQEARAYVRRGWSVIPLKPKSKEPLIKWAEYTERLPTDVELCEWFASSRNNLGIVTGRISNFVVLDVDGQQGEQSAQEFALQSTTIALTGKGKQYFFRPPNNMIANAVRVRPGLDIRSDRGYICAPPSLHPNGKRYLWLRGPAKNLPPFPDNVLAIIADGNKRGRMLPDQNPEGWVAQVLSGISEGNRNDSFARVVGKLHHSGLDKQTIWALLLPYARAARFAETELNTVIQSITRYPQSNTPTNNETSDVERFMEDISPVEWVCPGIFARGVLGFVAGLPETYKTWILLDLAVECARGGGLWLGLFPVEKARALFIDQERYKGETQRRIKGILKGKRITVESLRGTLFIQSGTSTRLNLDESFYAFKRKIAEIRPDIIFVDSFATFHTSDENDRMTIQKVIERVKEIKNEFGCSIIFVDHENKGAYSAAENDEQPSAGRMAGSVGKVAAAEMVMTVRRYDPSTCVVYHTKSTMGPRVQPFNVHVVDTEDGGIRVYGEGAK
jgi:KaiC/GvpD/RAD55 family RecA-like ATPase